MTSTRAIESPTPRQPGRLGKMLIRMFMKRATVVSCEPVGDNFRLITLESPQFKGIAWTPGQKIQIALGSAFSARIFTPIEWDSTAGRTRLLAYAHGAGPGSDWIRSVRHGDECDIFGPRASLDVSRAVGPVMIFGDETSLGLAFAAARHDPSRTVQCLLEVNSPEDTRHVLADCVEEVGGLTIQDVARSKAREGSFVLRQALGRAAGSALPAYGGSGRWQRVGTRLEHQTDLSA